MAIGHLSLNHQWDAHIHSLFILTLVWARGTNFSPMVLYRHLLIHKQTRVWVEVEGKVHKLGLQGPMGMSTLLHRRLSQLISRLYRACF